MLREIALRVLSKYAASHFQFREWKDFQNGLPTAKSHRFEGAYA
jgi:hypothetical protein